MPSTPSDAAARAAEEQAVKEAESAAAAGQGGQQERQGQQFTADACVLHKIPDSPSA